MAQQNFYTLALGLGKQGYTTEFVYGGEAHFDNMRSFFTGNGFKCPFTALAVRYGARTGHVFDSFLPERLTRYTFWFFGSLMAAGLLLLAARWLGIIH